MGARFSSLWTQHHPPQPSFTEKDVPDLHGKVYIVSGANTGAGKELARLLYSKSATVYMACRSEAKADAAIADIESSAPDSSGTLSFLHLDVSDLATVKVAAQRFLDSETRLHVLFNNAGAMAAPTEPIPRTKQGYELNLGVNDIGTFYFTQLLTPVLLSTAASEPGAVRVIWLSSLALELFAPKGLGISLDNLDYQIPKPLAERYSISKAGTWALGVEYARRFPGIISIPLNPGNLTSDLYRDQGFVMKTVSWLLGSPPVMGAYTELFAGLSPEITLDKSGSWGECPSCCCGSVRIGIDMLQ
jgi:retinol dehydrogenase-12